MNQLLGFFGIVAPFGFHGRTQVPAPFARTVAPCELEIFSYGVSHDWRAPLRAIDGFASILQGDHGDTLGLDGCELIARIRGGAKRMKDLIDALLGFSRTASDGFAPTGIDMNELVESVVQELQLGGEAAIEVGPLPDAWGDRALIQQAWSNYIGNAAKYSRGASSPAITIRGHQAPKENVYSVQDNGSGFDMAYADKIFGVLKGLHGDSRYNGYGIGLAIVQRIIRRHGGRVRAESRPDDRATFYFSYHSSQIDRSLTNILNVFCP